MSARKMTSTGDQLPLATSTSPLCSTPERVLLDDVINAATILILGDDAGIGTTTRDGLRREIESAAVELLRRWSETP